MAASEYIESVLDRVDARPTPDHELVTIPVADGRVTVTPREVAADCSLQTKFQTDEWLTSDRTVSLEEAR